MASIPTRLGKRLATGSVAKRMPLMWAWAVAEALVTTRRHWTSVDPAVRTRLRQLVTKSRGRLSNLTPQEKKEVRELVGRLDLVKLGREIGSIASPIPLRRRKR
jgi:hypothetical protein